MNRLVYVFRDSMFVCCNLGVIWLSLLINHRKVGPFAGVAFCVNIFMCILWDSTSDWWCVVGFFFPHLAPPGGWKCWNSYNRSKQMWWPSEKQPAEQHMGALVWVTANGSSATSFIILIPEICWNGRTFTEWQSKCKVEQKRRIRTRQTHQQRLPIRLTKRLETIYSIYY